MKLKKVKRCLGCRGYFISTGHTECTCGWTLEMVGREDTPLGEMIEDAPKGGYCYKPRTYKEYFESYELNRQRSLQQSRKGEVGI